MVLMAQGGDARDHVGMTNEPAEPTSNDEPVGTDDPAGQRPSGQPYSGPTANPGYPPGGGYRAGIRPLRRRATDRVVGGVAGGLGDYLNVDPILIRAAFAGLMIFGGTGLMLYVLGWILIPDEGHRDSIAQTALRTMANRTGRLGMLVLIVAVVVILSPSISRRLDVFYVPTEVFWALAIALIGVVLLLPRERSDGRFANSMASESGAERQAAASATPDAPSGISAEGQGFATTAAAGATAAAPVAWSSTPYRGTYAARPARPARPPRDPSPLGWYGIAGALLVVGVLALIDTVSTAHVLPGQYFGGGLLALGLTLVVGAWRGRARLLILLGLAVLPVAATAAFLTVPLQGGIGQAYVQPQQLADVQDAYHLVAGELWIDLSQLEAGSDPIVISATVGIGEIFVLVPYDSVVDVTGTVQGGRIWMFGRGQAGTALADHVAPTGPRGGRIVTLRLDAGIGQVQVERATVGGY